MARQLGILSFETQDYSNCRREGSTATNIIAGAARSGNFGLQTVHTSAAVDAGVRVTQAGLHTPALGARFDFRFRYFFKIVTLPSASNLFIGGIGGNSCRLELSTSGQLRLTTAGVTGTYAGALSTSRWYRADHRLFGLWPEGPDVNVGRQRAEIAVFDYGTDGLTNLGSVFSDSSQPTPRSTASQVGMNGGFYVNLAIQSCKTVEANLAAPSTYFHRITGVLPSGANGDYGQPPPAVFQSVNQINGPAEGAAVSQQGTCVEFGTVLGRQLHDFTIFNTGETPQLFLGQHSASVGGVSATREIFYDDIYWDWRSGNDADALADWPLGTRAYLFVPTSQGSLDQFTPAGGFGNIDDVPLVAGDQIQSTGAATQSTYDHAALAVSTDRVYAIKVAGNVLGSNPHKLLIGADELEVATGSGFSDQQNENTPYFGKPYDATPLTAAEFAALEFGVKAGTTGTFTVKNLWAEALTGPPETEIESEFDPDAIAVIGLTWMSTAIAPRHAGVDALQQLVATRQAELGETTLHTFEARDALVVTLERAERGAQVFVRYPQFAAQNAAARLWARLIDLATRLAEETAIDLPPVGGERYRLQAAYHEAGHVVAALALGIGVRRSTITVARRFGQAFGGETSYALAAQEAAPVQTLLRHALIARIGPLTPAVLLGHRVEQFGGADDMQIERTLQWLGLDEAERREAHTHLTALAHAFLHVAAHAAQIEAVATALLEQRTLTGQGIEEICTVNGVPLRAWALPGALLPGLIGVPRRI